MYIYYLKQTQGYNSKPVSVFYGPHRAKNWPNLGRSLQKFECFSFIYNVSFIYPSNQII